VKLRKTLKKILSKRYTQEKLHDNTSSLKTFAVKNHDINQYQQPVETLKPSRLLQLKSTAVISPQQLPPEPEWSNLSTEVRNLPAV
jgi:DNA-binding transcriptional regulator YdaS (Cro superfamily)